MRDHTKLKAFRFADDLAVAVYAARSSSFPKSEQFGLTAQLRRAAVSVTSSVVEGCARQSQADYLWFLDMAYGSAREVDYQLSLARRLGYLNEEAYESLRQASVETSKVLSGLIRSFRAPNGPGA